ncbi:MAG: hypothetical protein IKT40_07360 [Bacilli bacterium]|nr:hypothetical protein [Bacilli bacterium]
MTKRKYTEEQEKEIRLLQANNDMLKKTKEEIKLRGNENNLKRVELAQQDVFDQVRKIDPELARDMENETSSSNYYDYPIGYYDDYKKETESTIMDVYNRHMTKDEFEKISKVNEENNHIVEDFSTNISDNESFNFNSIQTDTQYDIISLPSNGQCYSNKVSRVPVSYLTAYDENLITSPNLYKDGMIIDFLLKQKVVGNSINLDELCVGDVDAIILFLRATSYGSDFPIVVRDPNSGADIESVVDLTTLKYKEFTLIGDENGYFEFELPISKDKVKFKFLTRKDLRILEKLDKIEYDGIKARQIKNDIKSLTDIIKSDTLLNGKEKQELLNDLSKTKPWIEKLEKNSPLPYSKTITNRLELSIMSVNGNTDRQYISKYVKNMGAKDSLMLRRYILENEPGVNFEIEVERPESLGGGSFKTFLEWDDSVFLNIS